MADLLPDAVVRYLDHADGIIDLHLPSTPNGTLVVLVHGGFWMQEWDRTHTRPLARALADLGFSVATPEYRRIGGGAPDGAVIADDVESAVARLLEDQLVDLGPTWDRVAAVGHSAGGHLALTVAERPIGARFDLVVGLAPVCDLTLAHELDLDGGAVARFLGDVPLAALDPVQLFAGPPTARVALVHGDEDELVPIALSRSFVAAHPWADLIELAGVGHFEFLDPTTPAWATLAELLRETDRDD